MAGGAGLRGGRALDRPDDWVRVEISEAFRCGVTVIPVLVGEASRLTDVPLPSDIAALARCQYLRLRADDAEYDLRRIVDELEGHGLRKKSARRSDVTMRARASGHGRVYQAGGDQVINE